MSDGDRQGLRHEDRRRRTDRVHLRNGPRAHVVPVRQGDHRRRRRRLGRGMRQLRLLVCLGAGHRRQRRVRAAPDRSGSRRRRSAGRPAAPVHPPPPRRSVGRHPSPLSGRDRPVGRCSVSASSGRSVRSSDASATASRSTLRRHSSRRAMPTTISTCSTPLLDRGVRKVKVRTGPEWRADLDTLADLRRRARRRHRDDGRRERDVHACPPLGCSPRHSPSSTSDGSKNPCRNCERAGIEALVAHSPVPVAYGEHLFGLHDAVEAMRRRQLDVLQPDAIHRRRHLRGPPDGRSRRRRSAFGSSSMSVPDPISLAANLHLAATVPSIRTIEYPPTLIGAWDAFGTRRRRSDPTRSSTDTSRSRRAPGLGVALDESAAAAHPYQLPGARAAGTTTGLPDRFVGDR